MFGSDVMGKRNVEKNFERYKDVEGTVYYMENMVDSWYETEASVHHEDGRIERFFVDFTRFLPMQENSFKMWVDLGMPSRYDIRTNGPMYPEDIEIAWAEKFQ